METKEKFPIPATLLNKSYISESTYDDWYQLSINSPEKFWGDRAEEFIDWHSPWSKVLEWDYNKAHIKWFLDAKLNVSFNCIDRHLPKRANQAAIRWEGNEPNDIRVITYQELYEQVCKFANVLKAHGIKKGDRVIIYMPMVPEAAYSMLACARIGAIHSVVFAGFSASAIRDRIIDCEASCVITANEALRGSKVIPLKPVVDKALEGVETVRSVLVFNRTDTEIEMKSGRDFSLKAELSKVSSECTPEILDSEDPLFILYTSGSTGKPKGVLHTQAGYILYAAFTHKYVFDYQEGDIYCCAADIGWITGHSYIVYGPLANGATTTMFESIPLYPDAGRYWDMVDRHKINIFYTAPTAIRAIAKEGDSFVKKYNRSSLRILGSVGEPINRDAWLWYYKVVGEEKCAVVDTWWQTETGGILISPLPGATVTKPGSATKPLFGIRPVIVDESGNTLEGNNVTGRLCIEFPWPGQMRTVYGDHKRFFDTYFSSFPGKYFTGDACHRDEDGYYWITGRVDDVLNVSGHRLGTAEVESAIVASGVVAEAAVVGFPHEIKGEGIYAFCILKDDSLKEPKDKILQAVRSEIGAFASPDMIQIVLGLPKTRSGKIMRRILRKIAGGEKENFGDISTLADPGVVEEILKGALTT